MKHIVQDYVHGISDSKENQCLDGEIFQICHTKNRLETGFCGWCGVRGIPTCYYTVFEDHVPKYFINEIEVSEEQFKEIRSKNEKVIKSFRDIYMENLKRELKTKLKIKKLNKTIKNLKNKNNKITP